MIKHIVFFNIKPEYSPEQKQKAIEEIIDALSLLPQKIKEIKSYEVFTNIEKDKGSDIGLIGIFENQEDLNKYRQHPAHQEAVEIINKHKSSGTFIDYSEPHFITGYN